jgi:tetratricopeptide (TPR) repeat protein
MARSRLFRLFASAILGAGAGAAQAQAPQPPSAATQLTRPEIDARIASWTATNDDPAARFSASAALAELTVVAEAAANSGYDEALRDVSFLIGQIEAKRHNGQAAVVALNKALSLSARLPPKPEQIVGAHFSLARLAERDGDYRKAAGEFRLALGAAETSPSHTQDHRLGIAQQLGYALHEAGQFEDALRVNRETLAGGEKLHGADDPRLKTIHINIAQNLHALDLKQDIKAHLKSALAMSRASGQIDYEQDMLFQLGVIAFETGRPDEARRWMTERIALLRQHKRDDLIEKALEDLKVLDDKVRSGSSK